MGVLGMVELSFWVRIRMTCCLLGDTGAGNSTVLPIMSSFLREELLLAALWEDVASL